MFNKWDMLSFPPHEFLLMKHFLLRHRNKTMSLGDSMQIQQLIPLLWDFVLEVQFYKKKNLNLNLCAITDNDFLLLPLG